MSLGIKSELQLTFWGCDAPEALQVDWVIGKVVPVVGFVAVLEAITPL